MAGLVERGLEVQADEGLAFSVKWGDLIEDAWRNGTLSEAQKAQYAEHAMTLRVEARAKVRKGDRVPAKMLVHSRAGTAYLLHFSAGLRSMSVEGQQLQGAAFSATGGLGQPGSPMQGRPGDIEIDFAP